MRKILVVFAFFLLASCADFVDEPKNLIPKDKMAELIAEISLNEETPLVNEFSDLESGTRFILKKHGIEAVDFNESYKYYAINRKIEPILEEAQEIIKDKHPEAEKFIEQKQKENPGAPPSIR